MLAEVSGRLMVKLYLWSIQYILKTWMLSGLLSPEEEAHGTPWIGGCVYSPELIRKQWHKENLWFSRESISSHAATARHSGLVT